MGDGAPRDAVAASGGLVTELVPGAVPNRWHFPWRNRIVSGLADATVVVEGRARSGALQTARLAAAQGREVFAVPGSLRAPASRGPLELIRDGARALTRLEDVLEVLGLPEPAPAGPRPPAARDAPLPVPLPGDTPVRVPAGGDSPVPVPADVNDLEPVPAAVLRLLGATPASPSALAAACGQPVSAVLAAVADLLARGLAAPTPNGPVAAPGPR